MRLRTKLFLTWAGIILVLWAGAFWSINSVIKSRIYQMAQDAFEGTQRGLAGMQRERVARMEQAGRLFLSIPELRALIAEKSVELTAENRKSLNDRTNDLAKLVDVSFVTVLDRDGRGIEQSDNSPWSSIEDWTKYTTTAPQSLALLRRIFADSDGASGTAQTGLWPYGGHLYQVVAIPLSFNGDTEPVGALVFGQQIGDTAATELGRSHNSLITLFSNGSVVASGLSAAHRQELATMSSRSSWPIGKPFVFEFAGVIYHGSIQPLLDPCSDTVVGQMLIQSDQQDAAVGDSILRSLVLIMLSGVVLAAIVSFATSAAITHPIQDLVKGVKRVAMGDLDLSLPVHRKDELGELSSSFNDMVSQLRSRRQLQQQFEEAQSASRAKSQFLANMSHEIRTPLNGVIGMTELLMGTPLTDQQRRYAAMVKTSGELLTTQINDILDFSKIEAGKLEIECIDFNLHETVEAVVELLSEKASKKKIELACHFGTDVPSKVRGDPDRLRQILVNLINNAIKFTHAGSIVVRLVSQAETQKGSVIRISVTDSGIGIPKQRMDRLFKAFSQVDASTTRKYGGTGLGLAICKQLAELMGGAIGVESEPNRGSTFWFTVKLEAPSVFENESSGSGITPEAIRVLAIDDSQTTCAVLREQLANWGLHADTICNPAEALGALRQAITAARPYKVAIIDSDMPGTSGFELARLIKSDPQLCKTILMALVPIESSITAPQLQQAGFASHMTKPVRQSQLFDSIMRAMAREHAISLRGEGSAVPIVEPTEPTTTAAARGRILVAEDNEVNQIVVIELLTRNGHTCDVVDNGLKAIESAMSGQYDLVLMDCQMPEMDGFEASRMIRQKEATSGTSRRIPIIALTANAIKGDREQCLEAGMDGYCSKPVDSRVLLAQIDSFLKQNGVTTPAPSECDAPAPTASSTLVEPAPKPAGVDGPSVLPAIVVDTLLERCLNNLATVETIMQKFEKQTQRDVAQIEQCLAQNDLTTAMRTAHSLKGAAAIVAAERLSGIAADIERFGRQQQQGLMQQQLSKLQEEVQRCVEYLPHVRAIASKKLAPKAPASGEV